MQSNTIQLIVSGIVTLGFITVVLLLMTLTIDFTAASGQAFLVLVGTLGASFTQVVNYWLGSSAGSAAKSVQLAAAAEVK